MGLRILNLEGQLNCMMGLKVTSILATFLSMIILGFFWIWNMSTVDNGGVSMGRSVAVSVSDTIF